MPFRSESQRRYLWAKHPRLARKWHEEYGTPKNLPAHVGEGGKAKEAADMSLEGKIIDTFQLAAAALEKAEAADNEKQARDQAVQAEIPAVVEALVRHGCIDFAEKEAAAKALADPVKALKILAKTAAFRGVDADAALGRPADGNGKAGGTTKRASAVPGSTDSCYVGARTTQPKPSDLAFLRGIGLDHLANGAN